MNEDDKNLFIVMLIVGVIAGLVSIFATIPEHERGIYGALFCFVCAFILVIGKHYD